METLISQRKGLFLGLFFLGFFFITFLSGCEKEFLPGMEKCYTITEGKNYNNNSLEQLTVSNEIFFSFILNETMNYDYSELYSQENGTVNPHNKIGGFLLGKFQPPELYSFRVTWKVWDGEFQIGYLSHTPTGGTKTGVLCKSLRINDKILCHLTNSDDFFKIEFFVLRADYMIDESYEEVSKDGALQELPYFIGPYFSGGSEEMGVPHEINICINFLSREEFYSF